MKRLAIFLLVMLASVSPVSYAQVPQASNPQKVAEYCYHCGWVKTGESHRSDCPYVHGGTSGSSASSGSSVRNDPAFGVAEAGINALGSLLSNLVASSFEPRQPKSTSSIPSDKPVLSMDEVEDRKVNNMYWIDKLFEDRDTWEYGDWVIALDGAVLPDTHGAKAISIRNKKTGEYVLGPIDSKTASLLEKDQFPAYTLLIAQLPINKEEYQSYASNVSQERWNSIGHYNTGRIKFFDSSRQNTPKELDGKLLIDGRWYWPDPEAKKKNATHFSHRFGLYQIEKNQLEPVFLVEPAPAPFAGERFDLFGNYGLFRYWHKAESKWLDETTTPRKNVIIEFMASDLYALDGKILRKDIIHLMPSQDSTFMWCLDYATLGGSFRDYVENKRVFSDYNYAAVDKDMNPMPQFAGYDFLSPQQEIADRTPVIAGSDGHYGVIDENGIIVIPLQFIDPVQVKEILDTYKDIAFSVWYKSAAERLIREKGEFEKQEHFEARSKDPQLQEAYLTENLGMNTEATYLKEMRDQGVSLSLGKYDAENEYFPVYFYPATWNSFLLPIPIAEAEAFKKAFTEIQEAALKDATYSIRYDAIALDEITFTLPSGKVYHARL